jgi:hypothetical protein
LTSNELLEVEAGTKASPDSMGRPALQAGWHRRIGTVANRQRSGVVREPPASDGARRNATPVESPLMRSPAWLAH